MGDLKESALTQKNDCKWVRALDENGNSIRISKEDLAAVVGGLLNSEQIYPFMVRNVINDKTIDFNDLEKSGMYSVIFASGATILNKPTGSVDGVLRVYRGENYGGDTKYIVQEFTCYNNNTYIRIRWGENWNGWMKMTVSNV